MIALEMVAVSFLLAAASASPQDSTEELRKENAELKKQFGELKDKVETLNTKLELYESKPVPPVPKVEAPEVEMMLDGDNALLTALKDVHLSGFVDMGYVVSSNSLHKSPGGSLGTSTANASGNPVRTFDTKGDSFYLNHVQVELEKVATDKFIVGYRLKLDAGNDPFLFDGQTVTCEEGYVEILAPLGRGLDIKAGKMATLAGAEVIESRDDINYSRSILFGFAIPFTHTGIRASYAFSDYVKATLGFNNGWNLIGGPGALAPTSLNTYVDSNHGKTAEFQFEVKPVKEFTIDATLYAGDENGSTATGTTPYASQYVFDLVANYSVGKVTLVANFDWGAHENDLAPAPPGPTTERHVRSLPQCARQVLPRPGGHHGLLGGAVQGRGDHELELRQARRVAQVLRRPRPPPGPGGIL